MVREPLQDVYFIESWKRYNYENTYQDEEERRSESDAGVGQALVSTARDIAEQ